MVSFTAGRPAKEVGTQSVLQQRDSRSDYVSPGPALWVQVWLQWSRSGSVDLGPVTGSVSWVQVQFCRSGSRGIGSDIELGYLWGSLFFRKEHFSQAPCKAGLSLVSIEERCLKRAK